LSRGLLTSCSPLTSVAAVERTGFKRNDAKDCQERVLVARPGVMPKAIAVPVPSAHFLGDPWRVCVFAFSGLPASWVTLPNAVRPLQYPKCENCKARHLVSRRSPGVPSYGAGAQAPFAPWGG
jgi:hypothetical protein